MTVDEILDEILDIEGGFVNDPADPGGATKHGVSLRYAKGIGLDNDADGDTDIDDIRLVTPEQARELFKEDFLYGPKIHLLPELLIPPVFDFAVNAGPGTAVSVLQRTLNLVRSVDPSIGFDPLSEDGLIGRKTIQAARIAQAEMGAYLVNAYCEEREKHYQELVRRVPQFRRFIRGWVNRARRFRLPVEDAA